MIDDDNQAGVKVQVAQLSEDGLVA